MRRVNPTVHWIIGSAPEAVGAQWGGVSVNREFLGPFVEDKLSVFASESSTWPVHRLEPDPRFTVQMHRSSCPRPYSCLLLASSQIT